jgi:hypothetical protein
MSVLIMHGGCEGGQGLGGAAGVVAAGGCDAWVRCWFEACAVWPCPGAVAGADLGGVFAVADAADVVQAFDAPVAAYPSAELGGVVWVAARLVMAWMVRVGHFRREGGLVARELTGMPLGRG